MNIEYFNHLKEVFKIIVDYIFSYYRVGNEKFLIPALICVLYMLFFEKEVRKKYIIPLIIMFLVILNPILYDKVFSRTYMYWRLFWVFSLHLIFGITFICVCERLKNDILRVLFFVALCFSIVHFGQENVFNSMEEANLPEKLPDGIAEVGELLLSLEDEPHIIADDELNYYIRQYSGKVKQLWGRNKSGFISEFTGEAKVVSDRMRSGDYDFLFDYALNHGYQFLITYHRYYPEEIANKYGYEIIDSINDFRIFYYTGNVVEENEGE